ncbi:hypothetical protein FYJ28_14975 [Arthrobacter sp. BL-252-APC-1A]|nr:hypothetical protein [Arthrobacter sp. BL-252-APC-1A]
MPAPVSTPTCGGIRYQILSAISSIPCRTRTHRAHRPPSPRKWPPHRRRRLPLRPRSPLRRPRPQVPRNPSPLLTGPVPPPKRTGAPTG